MKLSRGGVEILNQIRLARSAIRAGLMAAIVSGLNACGTHASVVPQSFSPQTLSTPSPPSKTMIEFAGTVNGTGCVLDFPRNPQLPYVSWPQYDCYLLPNSSVTVPNLTAQPLGSEPGWGCSAVQWAMQFYFGANAVTGLTASTSPTTSGSDNTSCARTDTVSVTFTADSTLPTGADNFLTNYQANGIGTLCQNGSCSVQNGAFSNNETAADFWIHPGPMSATLCANLPGQNATLDNIIQNSPPVLNLSTYLSNYGVQPYNVTVAANNPNPVRETADVRTNYQHPDQGTLNWYTNDVSVSNQDPSQILFHELDHYYYENGPFVPNNSYPNSATAMIGGITYTWTLTPVQNSNGTWSTSAGYDGYEHLLVHDDIVNKFKTTDTTGALQEALQEADNPPSNIASLLSQYRGTVITGSYIVPAVPDNQVCGSSMTHTQMNNVRPMFAPTGTFVPTPFIDPY